MSNAIAAEPGAGTAPGPTLELVRWTVTSGSNVQSRGAVVIGAGDHQWEASAEGNGPIDALYRAVDAALADVLSGHPRLLAFDIHALTGGTDAEGEVRVRVAPPAEAGGVRASGEYEGRARSTNIVAASIVAYIDALNRILAEAHWQGAAESAGNRRRARPARGGRRAELDEEAGRIDTTEWFNR